MIRVPGSYELPFGAKRLLDTKRFEAVVVLGCLLKGETMHFEYIAEAVTQGIMRLNLDYGVPVIFGVLTCLAEAQAKERARSDGHNFGYIFGRSAVAMALAVAQP